MMPPDHVLAIAFDSSVDPTKYAAAAAMVSGCGSRRAMIPVTANETTFKKGSLRIVFRSIITRNAAYTAITAHKYIAIMCSPTAGT